MELRKKIKNIKLCGDFFIHPEESLYEIEKALVGLRIDSSKEEIISTISRVIAAEKAELIGITPEAIAETIGIAVKRCNGE